MKRSTLTPVLEQTNVFNALNFSFPVYVHTSTIPGTGISGPNTTVVGTMVGLFLCPSDRMQRITTTDGFAGGPDRAFAPSNYHFCAGDGSVHVAKNSIDSSTWGAAGTRAGGEVNAFPF